MLAKNTTVSHNYGMYFEGDSRQYQETIQGEGAVVELTVRRSQVSPYCNAGPHCLIQEERSNAARCRLNEAQERYTTCTQCWNTYTTQIRGRSAEQHAVITGETQP